jgi:prophage tail gpP-like protein
MPEMTIYIDGYKINPESAELLRTMDTGADALTMTLPWQPGNDPVFDDVTKPFGYQDTECFIDNNIQLLGRLYNVEHSTTEAGTIKNLECYSKTADIIDSTMLPPFEANNIGLLARCKQQCEPFGIGVVVDDSVQLFKKKNIIIKRDMNEREKRSFIKSRLAGIKGTFPVEPIKQEYLSAESDLKKKIAGGYKITVGRKTVYEEIKFSRVAAKQTDKIFNHLRSLAAQRGYLLSCTLEGDLFITKANTDGKSIGTIEEGSAFSDSYEAKFNGRNRFAQYRAIAKSSRKAKTAKASVAEDNVVQLARYLTFNAPDNLPGQAENAAIWKKNKTIADALTIPFPVNSIYGPDGKLWEPNTLITVISETLGVDEGFTFLIRNVRFVYNNSGFVSELDLVPPTVYTTGEIEEPWI